MGKTVINTLILLAALLLLQTSPSVAELAGQQKGSGPFGIKMPKCNVCHSKDPKIRAMHKALDYKDCFTCHGPGKLWPKERRQEQKILDPLCTRCHVAAQPASADTK